MQKHEGEDSGYINEGNAAEGNGKENSVQCKQMRGDERLSQAPLKGDTLAGEAEEPTGDDHSRITPCRSGPTWCCQLTQVCCIPLH